MRTQILVIAGFLMLAISGCSGKESEQSTSADSSEPQHVWKEQVKALDKAKKLEEDMNAAFEKRAGEMDRQAR